MACCCRRDSGNSSGSPGSTINYLSEGNDFSELPERLDDFQQEEYYSGENSSETSDEVTDSSLLVAAIDFGTTYSGYAFSFRHEYERDPLKAATHTWIAGTGGILSLKAPTCILFDPDGRFKSFGFEAEDEYFELASENEHKGWRFFRHFKMELYKRLKLNRSLTLKDDQGQEMSGLKVFASAIRFLKDHMINTCKNMLTELRESDIKWVLTVPAIWNDASKQFMREAAMMAGIGGNNLVIALEPEAASLYCKHIPLERSEHGNFTSFSAGSKYLVVDAGGGTVDITAHEVQDDHSLKEIYKANGGGWGGTNVDNEFQNLISEIVGKEKFASCVQLHKADTMELFRDFEIKKRKIKQNMGAADKVSFKIPSCFTGIGKGDEGSLVSAVLSNQVSVVKDKLRFNGDILSSLFKPTTSHIIQHIKRILNNTALQGLSSILLVGGFAESLFLQEEIRSHFPSLRTIIPPDAGLA